MSKRVLLVDDSPVIHNLLRRSLESHGFEICGDAKNGAEGVDLFKLHSPDIIFMDITMPIMDGLEASKAIKAINPQVKIIMLSAMGDEQIIASANEIGVDIFLKKPFDDYKIISALSKLE